jgi:hypothetical protein
MLTQKNAFEVPFSFLRVGVLVKSEPNNVRETQIVYRD